MKRLQILIIGLITSLSAMAQRPTDILDRGLVAVPSGNGTFVSWRIFGEEYYDVEYNLYRNGVKVNQTPLKVSNYTDTGGTSGATYQVAAVVRGVEQEKCEPVSRLNQQYIQFAVGKLYSRRGTDITSSYNINDISLADVDGDGVSEFILKRNYGPDGSSVANDSAFNCIECYNISGQRLWWIDLGPNMVSGPDEQYDAVGYDWDGDGKAEILMRGADNMIIHHADGTTTNIGDMKVNTRNTVLQQANMTYTNSGNEYLLYLEGATGKPYPIGSGTTPLWMTYPLPRGNASDWGDGYGHRSTKHYFGAPFLDGRHPYIFLGRGCYTKHHMKAFSVNPTTHKLTLYWEWANNNGWNDPWYGNGFHNYGIADVDWDGRDEIVFGSMVIDDNGKGLSTTGLGHGDAQHCSDFDPFRHGQEIFTCNEDEPAMNYRDATTSKIYYRLVSTSDDGRALCGNFSNDYPGAIGHSSQSGTISCVADKVISGGPGGFTNNFRIYWDGDLLEEGLDGASSREGAARVFKANGSVVFTADGTANCNWTKNTPSATGDILGDWREEIIARTSDNKYVRIYTTNIATKYRNYTLWHDHQYRQGMVWESIGYNQPPHASYFLGELEGITVAPPPLTTTGRTEVKGGETISTTHNGQHVLVCEYANTDITIAEGAQPWILTLNVPSWVQGTNSNITDGGAKIDYTYYTCNVGGAPLTGDMRLIKQGDGILSMDKATHTYTGETNVWAGTLKFDGTLESSPLWLNRFTTLISDGGQFGGGITMNYDATLRPGGTDHQGTIETTSLAMNIGSRIVFDIYSQDLQADMVKATSLKIERKTWEYGPKYLTPVFEFVIHPLSGKTTMESGRYPIMEVETITGSIGNIIIEGVSGQKATLEHTDGVLYLVIEGVRDPGSVVWTGAESNKWDFAQSMNFKEASSDKAELFVANDKVLFGDDAKTFTVSLQSELVADSVIINSTKNYTLNGVGFLSGKTKLVKQGTGTLTIENNNTYTGGTRISGGTVKVSTLSNQYKEAGNLGAVSTLNTRFIIENGATLNTTAAVQMGSPIRLMTDEGGVINNSADFIMDKAFSGTKLTKRGNGWLKTYTAGSSLTRMVIAGGTVENYAGNAAQTVELQGGALRDVVGTSNTIFVDKSKKGSWTTANRATYTNTLTGEGEVTVYCATEKGSSWYATRTPLRLKLASFEGTLLPQATYTADGRFTLDTSSGSDKFTLNIPEGIIVQNSGKTLRIGHLTGKGTLGGSCTFDNNTTVGANTWQVGNDEDFTFEGIVTSKDAFTKMGSGKMSVKGAWTMSGAVNLSEGTTYLSNSASLGTGTLTVGTGATLYGTGTLTNSSYTINGTIQAGILTTSLTGSIDMSGANVTIGTNGIYRIGARRCATEKSSGCTSITNIGRMTINGTIEVFITNSSTLNIGDSILVFDSQSFAGKPKFILPLRYTWDTSRISEGLIFITGYGIDINGDESVDTQDILSIYEYMQENGSTGGTDVPQDVNHDGVVDTQDVLALYEYISGN